MKGLIFASLGVLVGLVAGSWGPREDLKALKARAEESATLRKASDASGFGAFAKMVNIPDVAKRPLRRTVTNAVAAASASATNAVPAATNGAPAGAQPPKGGREAVKAHLSREDLRTRIDEAAELWRTRVELAKTQWKARLDIPEGEKSAAFDSALNTMNEALLDAMTALAEEIDRSEKMTPELGLRLMGDATRVMAETYDAIGAVVSPERRAEVSEMPVFEFIDPSVAEPLVGVQGKLDAAEWRRPRR